MKIYINLKYFKLSAISIKYILLSIASVLNFDLLNELNLKEASDSNSLKKGSDANPVFLCLPIWSYLRLAFSSVIADKWSARIQLLRKIEIF